MNYVSEYFENRYGAEEGLLIYKKLRNSKNHARTRKIEVDLDWEDIDLLAKPLLGYGFCDYTGEPFGEDDMKPTIERIDASKGYVRGNICIVTLRANMAKNYIYDLPDISTTISPECKEAVRLMMQNCTGEHMESLKNKYVPKKSKDNAISEEKTVTTPEKVEVIDEVKEEVVISEEKPTAPAIPEDIQIAEMYSRWLRAMLSQGYEVTMTFSEFKTLVKSKRCFITGQPLDESKLPVMLDPKGNIERSNIKFANENAANALNKLLDQTGLTVSKLVSNLKKTVK